MKKILVLLTIAATAFSSTLSAEENMAYEQTTDPLLAQNCYAQENACCENICCEPECCAPCAGTCCGTNFTPFLIGLAAAGAIAGIVVAATNDSSSTCHTHS